MLGARIFGTGVYNQLHEDSKNSQQRRRCVLFVQTLLIKKQVLGGSANLITMLLFKNIHNEKAVISKLVDIFELGRLFFNEEKGLKYLESVIRYLFATTSIKPEDFIEKIKYITPKGGEIMMTTAEKLIEEGKKLGEQKGFQLGEQKGFQIGEQKSRSEDIKKLLSKGFEPKQIAELLEIDLSAVENIKREL